MRAQRFQLLRDLHVVVEGVFRAVGVVDVAGIAERRLQDTPRLQHRIAGDAHVLDPVERVEDAEHVHPRCRRLADEELHHVVGQVGVAHPVGRAHEHLRQQVRHGRAQVAQALPRVFLQEAVGHVEGRPAPAFHREQVRQGMRVGGRDLEHVDGAHPGGEERLVRVAHGRVGQEQAVLRQHPVRHRLRPLRIQHLLEAVGRGARHLRRAGSAHVGGRARAARRLGVPVHGDVADEGQQLRRPVPPGREVEQLGRLVDELRVVGVVQEALVLQQVLHEGDVRRHAADAELPQRPVHARDGRLGRGRPGRDLLQQRIVVARDDRARIGRPPVEPDAEARRPAIGGDAAVIGDEVVERVLGGDAALDGVAVQLHVALRGRPGRLDHRLALGDEDLRADDVDAGDLLGHRMLDLHAGVDLDEVEGPRGHVHQELDRARAFIGRVAGDPQAQFVDLRALVLRQVGRGRAFHDLLVAALDGAVALVEVEQRAVLVAEDLHLDMPRLEDQLLQIALAVAEGGLGLRAALADLRLQLVRPVDGPHPAPAPAPGRLEHQRVAHLLGHGADAVHCARRIRIGQHLGRGHDRNAGLDGRAPRARLVAQHPHRLGLRPDEGDPVLVAGIDEVGVLGQKAVARMDRVRPARSGDPNYFRDREIRLDRPQPLADVIRLVRLEAVQPQLVLLGIDGDRGLAEFVGRAADADGDLAPVRDEDFLEVCHGYPCVVLQCSMM